jgi:hypothetical protein
MVIKVLFLFDEESKKNLILENLEGLNHTNSLHPRHHRDQIENSARADRIPI